MPACDPDGSQRLHLGESIPPSPSQYGMTGDWAVRMVSEGSLQPSTCLSSWLGTSNTALLPAREARPQR